MHKPYVRCAGLIPLAFAFVARAQSVPQTMVLDYHDAPTSQVLADMSRLGFVTLNPGAIDEKITLTSDGPVNAEEGASLLQQALWPLGYRLTMTVIPSDTNKDNPNRILQVEKRPTTAAPGEVRVWHATPRELPQRAWDLKDTQDAQNSRRHLGRQGTQ